LCRSPCCQSCRTGCRAKRAADLVRRPFHAEHGVPKQSSTRSARQRSRLLVGASRLGKSGMAHHLP
jgi:hypothetical protein